MSIKIFVTGGTFDKEYDEIQEKLIFRKTHVQEMLAFARCEAPVSIEVLLLIDSLEMTEEQREIIAQRCAKVEEKSIVVTHGTGTMTETAAVIAKRQLKKTIVLTGAMIPYRIHGSDSLFNMGMALALCQTLPPGVYITMNGKCFQWHNVRKDVSSGAFEELSLDT